MGPQRGVITVRERLGGDFDFLCPEFPVRIELEGRSYPTVDHFVLVQKFASMHPELAERIRAAPSAAAARRIAQTAGAPPAPGWEGGVGEEVMKRALEAKFAGGSPLAALLLATGDAKLVEGAPQGQEADGTSGVGKKNVLGQLLMEVRERLQASELYQSWPPGCYSQALGPWWLAQGGPDIYGIEYAKSGRAKCSECSKTIGNRSLRLGVGVGGGASFKWQHWSCVSCGDHAVNKIGSPDKLRGLAALESKDQDTVRQRFAGAGKAPRKKVHTLFG